MFRLIVVLWAALTLGAAMPTLAAESQAVKVSQAVVNVNTANAAELEALPGIGKVTAGRIVAYREANGPFASVDDLVKVKGIGSKVLEKVRGQIVIH